MSATNNNGHEWPDSCSTDNDDETRVSASEIVLAWVYGLVGGASFMLIVLAVFVFRNWMPAVAGVCFVIVSVLGMVRARRALR